MSGFNRRNFLRGTAVAAPLLASGASRGVPAIAAQNGDQAPADGAGGQVVCAADLVAAQGWRPFAGHKLGVISNPTGVLRNLGHIVDSMVAAGVKPVAVFGPEHGFRGTGQAGNGQPTYPDPRTGITVYDAYNVTADTLAGMYRTAGVDLVVFDIASVGARFYTYTWTMYVAMHAAVIAGVKFVVLDRPNPIGGQAFGPQMQPAYETLVGLKPIVQQPGMTLGELAGLFNAEFLPGDTGGKRADLEVLRVRGWRRDQLWPTTGLQWVIPSPNMPTFDTAVVYPGTCMFEGTLLSEGRGSTKPFQMIGAPGIDWRWAEDLNAANLPAVRFRENYFVPTFDKFTGKTCGGVEVQVSDPHSFDPIRTAVTMLVTAKKRYPSIFGWRSDDWIDKLTGSNRLRTMIDAGAGVDDVIGAWQKELSDFRQSRQQYLLYP